LNLLASPEDRARDYVKVHGHTAGDVMTRDVIAVGDDTPVGEIAEILEKRRIKRVPVVRNGDLVGIVSRANLLHGLAAHRDRMSFESSLSSRPVRRPARYPPAICGSRCTSPSAGIGSNQASW
jgi:CBS-domain-containing membrane protein